MSHFCCINGTDNVKLCSLQLEKSWVTTKLSELKLTFHSGMPENKIVMGNISCSYQFEIILKMSNTQFSFRR